MLISFKCHSQSIEKKSHDNFEGGLPFDSQLAKLKFFRFCGDDPKLWSTKVERFFNYQGTPNSQKVYLASFHVESETNEWYQLIF